MSLANGRSYLAIPGPSAIPDRVLREMHRASPNIYEGDLIEMVAGIIPDLKSVARTKLNATIYIANGHGSWEAAIANVLAPGDEALVLSTGRFALGWAEVAKRHGVNCTVLDFGNRDTIHSSKVEDVLRADKEHRIKAVMTVQVDTATSIKNDIPGLRKLIDTVGHPALFMVDCIASLGCDRFEMDDWGVDVMVTGCQKGLMTPAGTAFVFFNDKADAVREKMERVSYYWDWRQRANPKVFSEYFAGTAPTHHLFGLRAALDMIGEEGIENVWARHATLARAYWAALEAWGSGGPIEMNVGDPALRSHAVTAVRIGAPHGARLRKWLEQNAGVTLGIGLGMAEPSDPKAEGFFRIGHMGHVNTHMVLGVVGAIEAGLQALDIPHGKGATAAAAAVCAAG